MRARALPRLPVPPTPKEAPSAPLMLWPQYIPPGPLVLLPTPGAQHASLPEMPSARKAACCLLEAEAALSSGRGARPVETPAPSGGLSWRKQKLETPETPAPAQSLLLAPLPPALKTISPAPCLCSQMPASPLLWKRKSFISVKIFENLPRGRGGFLLSLSHSSALCLANPRSRFPGPARDLGERPRAPDCAEDGEWLPRMDACGAGGLNEPA